MGGKIQNIGPVKKGVLRAVPVVDVPVHHQDLSEAVLPLQVFGGDSHVVEQAESHGAAGFGMVTGRPDRGERVPDPAGQDVVQAL